MYKYIDWLAGIIFYQPVAILLRLFQATAARPLQGFFEMNEQEQEKRAKEFKAFRFRCFLAMVWIALGMAIAFPFAALVRLGEARGAGTLFLLAVGVILFYYWSIVFIFWLDILRFYSGQRYEAHTMYLTKYFQIDDQLALHFFTLADLIAYGETERSQEKSAERIERSLREALAELRFRMDAGALPADGSVRFVQYALHPQRLNRLGFQRYEPRAFERIKTIVVATWLWPRIAYISSFTRVGRMEYSNLQRLSFHVLLLEVLQQPGNVQAR